MTKWLSSFFVVVWVALIFRFSTQTGSESAELSRGVLELFRLDPDVFHTPIRKTAHMVVYFVLGAMLVDALKHHGLKGTQSVLVALALAIAVAVADETVQHFIPGRVGALTDVFFDTIGATVGIALMNRAKQMVELAPQP